MFATQTITIQCPYCKSADTSVIDHFNGQVQLKCFECKGIHYKSVIELRQEIAEIEKGKERP